MVFTYVVEAATARTRDLSTAETWSLERRGGSSVGDPSLAETDCVMSGGGCG